MQLKNIKKTILSLFALFATILVSAQGNYNFNKRNLVSGTDKQQGAKYRFSLVQSGVDALITIDKLTRSALLDSLDFSATDLTVALQPALSVAPHCWGYIQFKIEFVKAGTSTPVAVDNIPAKGKIPSFSNSNYTDAKLDVVSNSATSFKVRMYTVNKYGHTLNTKADLLIQKFDNENERHNETAATIFPADATGK